MSAQHSGNLSAQDEAYEADLKRNPYSLKNWLYYLAFKVDAPKSVRYSIYERALEKLPRSYKLWHLYLTERITECKGRSLRDPLYEETNNAFERALVHMHKMPVIWTMFLDFQTSQKRITSTRRNFDRALCALPITQHTKFVWPGYLRFADECGVAETAMRIWRRYIKISPKEREEYIAHLRRANRLDEAAKQLAAIINDESFVSQQGRAKHDLWTDLLKLIVRHPLEVTSIDVEAVIRSGIRKYPHEVARLWTSLADYYIRLGTMERARDIYAEAIDAVLTVRDFSIVYQAYTKFEETLIATRMKELDLLEAAAAGDPAALKELAGGAQGRKWTRAQIAEEQESLSTEIDMRMMRLSKLVDSRPLLLNSVLLRQNPHSVEEWLNRVKLCGSDILRTVQTYTQAVSTVDPAKADGKLHILWVRFALFYASKGQISDARTIFDRAVNVEYRTVDALAHVYCRWIEMELLHKYPDEAIAVAQRACHPPKDYRAHKPGHFTDTSIHVAERVYRHPKLWSFLVDLQESFGSLESTRAVYERMIQLRVITPQMILNYARLLEEKNFFEESFRVYEKGIAIFPYPHVAPIWLAYLRKFTQRYGGRKIERTRDLFEQATAAAPAEHARKLYLLYAKFEEAHGLGRSVTKVYERAVKAVPEKERLDMYFVYIARVTDLFGAIKTREIYDEAMQSLPDADIPLLALRYSSLERALGDIDRARAIFTYAAQSCDPAKDPNFWNEFKLFETQHGNEDTFRDMVKIRRAVQAHYAQSSVVAAAMAKAAEAMRIAKEKADAAGSTLLEEGTPDPAAIAAAASAALSSLHMVPTSSASASASSSSSSATSTSTSTSASIAALKRKRDAEEAQGSSTSSSSSSHDAMQDLSSYASAPAPAPVPAANPDEINLDDDDDNGGDGDAVTTRALPATLFGSLGKK